MRVPRAVHGRTERLLLASARAVTARPKTILALWIVLVALSAPFALRVSDVLTEQGASKVVEGTGSAAVADTLRRDFPAHSEREVTVVLQGWDAKSVEMRQLLAILDGALASPGEGIRSTVSAYTLLRDGTVTFVEGQLRAAGVTRAAPVSPHDLRQLRQELRRQSVTGGLADLVVASVGVSKARVAALAGDFVVAADWATLDVPGPVRALMQADTRTTVVAVAYEPTGPDPEINDLRKVVSAVVASLGLDQQVSVHVTGEIPLLQDTYAKAEADNAKMEYVAYAIILLVLLLFFRAITPALITVAVIGLAMNVSQAWLYFLGSQVQLTQFTSTIMTFVMLGAGVDYSMLLSSRYRQERVAGRSVNEAVVQATARAGESALLAGAAVVLSFGATLLSPVDWIPPLGYGGLVGIPIILLAALTITPCLLMLLGDRFFWLGVGQLGDLEHRGLMATVLRRSMAFTRRWHVVILIVFAVATVPAVMTANSHQLSGDPIALSPVTDARAGAEVVSNTWGKSYLFPTVVAGPLDPNLRAGDSLTQQGADRMSRLVDALESDPGVEQVSTLTQPGQAGTTSAFRRDYLSPEGSARIVVTLRGDPFADAARDTVSRVQEIVQRSDLQSLRVGGATQVDMDYGASLKSSFWRMVAAVSIGIFLLLLLALRSLLIPVRLVLTIMMSNVWAIALTLVVFEVCQHAAVIDDLPVFLVILMMGLGMDYEIFLVTRVRDLVRQGYDDTAATTQAVVDTGRVITAAGLVMAGSLGTMMLSSTLMLQQYGLGLGAAVLLDATLVRMFFVPASLLSFQRFNWWVPALPFQRLRLRSS